MVSDNGTARSHAPIGGIIVFLIVLPCSESEYQVRISKFARVSSWTTHALCLTTCALGPWALMHVQTLPKHSCMVLICRGVAGQVLAWVWGAALACAQACTQQPTADQEVPICTRPRVTVRPETQRLMLCKKIGRCARSEGLRARSVGS